MAHGLPGEPGADDAKATQQMWAIRDALSNETKRRASHYDALVEALKALSEAVNRHGVCVCGHDGKLTSDDCPLHGVGANMARAVLAQIAAKEK